ncbi:DUF2971 domain-containing protein [Rhodobacteraceae bacterium R_SAG7]|nr:DUF2971 domain-containing protein [Rhodobacteraceae bacterium R_SAG7]
MCEETTGQLPDVLWHYTTFDTLTKILASRCLLASDFRDTNDREEILFGFRALRVAFGTHNTWSTTEGFADPVPDDIRANEETIIQDLETRFVQGQMICLSSARDSLSMWRGYGQLTNGGGNGAVAIGFCAADLHTLCGPSDATLQSSPAHIQQNASGGFEGPSNVDYAFRNFPQLSNALSIEDYSADFHIKWTHHLAHWMKHRKHPAFAEEREYRIWGSARIGSLERQRQDFTILGNAYRRKFHLAPAPDDILGPLTHPLAIQKIMVGPKTDFGKVERFTRNVFQSYTQDRPDICASKIPFK